MTTIQKLWENRKQRLWQTIYDRSFCEGLDKGLGLDEACEYADMKVLTATSALMHFDPDSEI